MPASPLRLLVAPDKFKGSLDGPGASAAIAAGLRDALGDDAEIIQLPVADGGEGMARAVTAALAGKWIAAPASDPLGRAVEAGFGLIPRENAGPLGVIEMAEASGLWRLAPEERDPWRASTRGTGELMLAAIRGGASELLLGIGGSATNDGGSGMAAALGFRFLDASGREVGDLPARLEEVERVIPTAAILPPVLVACDVTNPLLGEEGCTRVYGPQKGISSAAHGRHEARLAHLLRLSGKPEAATLAGAGAAGGLGFGCLAWLNATLKPGFDLVADILGLEDAVRAADVVITGEGKLDAQTLQGKAPAGVAALARRWGKPVAALAGAIETGAEEELARRFDFTASLVSRGGDPGEAMRRAAPLLREAARRHAPAIAALAR